MSKESSTGTGRLTLGDISSALEDAHNREVELWNALSDAITLLNKMIKGIPIRNDGKEIARLTSILNGDESE